jgi:BppU N-terminal domain/Phage tail repeat like
MVKTFDILLDLEKELYSPSSLLFSVSRNDFNTVQLHFIITQDGTPFDLTNKTVELAVKKPSGLTVYQACEITNALGGKTKLDLNQQAYIEYGIYTAEVYIRDANQLAVTSPFWYQSRTPIFNDTTEEAIESSNDWSALQEALFAYDLRPKLIEGFPTITPEYIGQMAFDSLNKITYIASDLTSNSWRTFGSGEGGGGGGNDTMFGDNPLNFTPARIGQMFIDEINENVYIAIGATAEDWLQIDNEDFVKHAITWGEILEKPTTFAPSEHGHEIMEVSGLQDALDLKANGVHSHDWAEIDNKPLTFAPEAHNHDWAEIDGKPLTFVPEVHAHAWVDITDKPLTFTPEAHNHEIGEITGLQGAIDSKSNVGASYLKTETYSKGEVYNKTEINQLTFGTGEGSGVIVEDNLMSNSPTNALSANQGRILEEMKADVIHNHTWGEITGKPLTFAPNVHTHTKAQITDFAHTHTKAQITDFAHNHDWAEVTGKPLTFAPEAHSHDWVDIADKPLTFTPEAHNHEIGEITGLQGAIDSKADNSDLTAKANITDVYTKLETYNKTEVDGIVTGITEGGGTIVEDNLLSNSTSSALSANQGRILDETKADITHNHDTDYSPINHNHDTDYSPINHNHDTDYSPINHVHAISEVAGLQASLDTKANDSDLLNKADSIHSHDWAEIEGKPLAFVPEVHAHAWVDITDKPLTFTPESHSHNWDEIQQKPTTFAPSAHSHVVSEVTGLQTFLDSKANDNHLHDERYSRIGHKHDDLYSRLGHSHDWAEVTGKPTTFTPEAHNHEIGEITGLQASLDSKADSADLNGLTLWSGTQAEYDAIATKDVTTLYFITG